MSMSAFKTSSRDQEPRPLPRQRRKLVLMVISGLAMAGVLLLVVFNIDAPAPTAAKPPDDSNITELLPPPGALTPEQMKHGITDPSKNPQVLAAEGGWIQTTKDGKLAQQYRFVRVDPQPDGQLAMTAPIVQLFLSDERVLTMRSDDALVRAPTRSIESGTLRHHVIIRLYVREPGKPFKEETATPSMEMRTEEASFDNFQGEVTCGGDVDIQTPTAKLPGHGLRLVINEVESRPTWFSLVQAGPVRISHLSSHEAQAATQPEPATSPRQERASHRDAANTRSKPDRPQNSAKPSGKKPVNAQAPQFYHLTFLDNVRIQQGDGSTGWIAENADELHIIFSMQSKELSTSLAARSPGSALAEGMGVAAAQPIPALLASLAVAAVSDEPHGLYQPADDEIVITCDGGMTMVPVTSAAEMPDSPEDARFNLTGRPLRLINADQATLITCAGLGYQTLSQQANLKSSADSPLTIDSPELHVVGDQLWLSRLDHKGAFNGPGWMTAKETAAGASTQPESTAKSTEQLRIDWRDKVDLGFESPAANTDKDKSTERLQSAKFAGDVHVSSSDLLMGTDSLNVGFAPSSTAGQTATTAPSGAAEQRTIRFIDADGSVKATSVTDQGSIQCKKLHVDFTRDPSGRASPASLDASGDVAAIDRDKQTIWSQALAIAFQPFDEPTDSAATQPTDASQHRRSAQVKTLTAVKDVQVRTADGTRAFADRLDADAASQKITLTGDDLLIISDRTAMSGGNHLEMQKADNTALWPGAGEFINFTTSIIPSTSTERVDRPTLNQPDNPVQLRASWADSMRYDGAVNDGAGSITLNGSVAARSTSNAMEDDTMSGRSLTLDFIKKVVADSQPAATTEPASMAQGSNRALKVFTADGDAKLESHSWLKADRSDSPRIFYISGPTITHDAQTLETHVPGAGQLLVRDDRVDAQPASRPASQKAPFASKGTTDFRWTDRLDMTQQPDGTYDVAMIGGIEVRHMAIDGAISTMTGNQLHARLERIAAAKPKQDATSLDLGGTMELKGLRGSGGVLIHTPERDVDCDDFDYDYSTGTAILTARDDRVVTVMSKGNPQPLQAKRVVWNMVEDKVTATNVSGGGPR